MVTKAIWPLSGELEGIMKAALELAEAENAPAVRLDHFLVAFMLDRYPPDRALEVLQKRVTAWENER